MTSPAITIPAMPTTTETGTSGRVPCTHIRYDADRVWQNVQLWRTQVAEHNRAVSDRLIG